MTIRNGSPPVSDVAPVKKQTDQRIIRLHVDYIRREGRSARTMRDRRDNLLRLADALPVDLLAAQPEQLDDWQAGLTVGLSSIATYTSHVRAFYQWAVDVGHIDVNPAVRLARTKVPPRSPRPIPPADFEMALECAAEPIFTWLVLGGFMGLRAAEIAGLRRESFSEGIIGGKRRLFVSGIGKGGRPFKLPVPVEVVPVVQRHLTARPGALWHNRHGRPISPNSVTSLVSDYFRRIGMPYTLHWTRHTYGTEVQQRTGDILQTKVLMRHRSVNTTLLYVQPADGAGVAAMDQLSQRLTVRLERRRDRTVA